MLKRKPIPVNHGLEVNTNNLRAYEPYYDDGKDIIIDPTWWKTVPNEAKNNILYEMNPVFKEVKVPHDDPGLTKKPREKFIYNAYVDAFDYNHWYSAKDGECQLLKIPAYIKRLMAACNITGRKPHPDIVEWIEDVYPDGPPFKPCFARLGGTSGKNEKRPEPLETNEDLLRYLTQGNYILVRRELSVEDKDTYLILMPWIDIERKFEFRVFFRNNKVIGASQQFTGTLFNYTQEELEKLTKCFRKLSFPEVPYYEWTADVYWDPVKKKMNLIECNPYGAHSGAGASLFEWNRDREIFEGKSPPEFRYLSVINF